jgi:TPR repeat protein
MSERIRLRSEIVQQPALKPRSPRRRTAPWQPSPASFVCLAVLTITGLGYWCWDHATLEARANRGEATAQYRFGKQTLETANTAAAYAQAVEWIRLAANQGNANAQTALGQLYLRGFGVQRDYSEAAKWLRRAADQGAAVAQNELGIMYAKGLGCPRPLTRPSFGATKLQRKASQSQSATLLWLNL